MSTSTPAAPQMREGVLDHREVAQAQEVHLQQAQLLHAVHVELGDGAPGVVLGILRQLQRQVVDERGVPDHDAGGVHRVLSSKPLERPGGVHDLPRLRLLVVGIPQLGRQLERLLDRMVAAHHHGRVHLAQPVADARGKAQHASGIADALLSLDRLEGDDLGHVIRSVLLRDVADHLVPATLVEVHVDVGHLQPPGVEEALEDEPVAEGVEVGDAKRVGDHRAGRGSPAGAHADAVIAREPDQVPDHQEVSREAHVADHAELVLDPPGDLGRDGAVPLGRALVDELAQILLERGCHPGFETAGDGTAAPRAPRPRRGARRRTSPRSRGSRRRLRGARRRRHASPRSSSGSSPRSRT